MKKNFILLTSFLLTLFMFSLASAEESTLLSKDTPLSIPAYDQTYIPPHPNNFLSLEQYNEKYSPQLSASKIICRLN